MKLYTNLYKTFYYITYNTIHIYFHFQPKINQVFTNEHITTVHVFNAAGSVLPSTLVIFSKNIPGNIDVSTLPKDFTYASTESGYLNKEMFLDWLK